MSSSVYWSVIEPSLAILAVSIPSLKPVAMKYVPSLVGSYARNRGVGYGVSGPSYPLDKTPSRSKGKGTNTKGKETSTTSRSEGYTSSVPYEHSTGERESGYPDDEYEPFRDPITAPSYMRNG